MSNSKLADAARGEAMARQIAKAAGCTMFFTRAINTPFWSASASLQQPTVTTLVIEVTKDGDISTYAIEGSGDANDTRTGMRH